MNTYTSFPDGGKTTSEEQQTSHEYIKPQYTISPFTTRVVVAVVEELQQLLRQFFQSLKISTTFFHYCSCGDCEKNSTNTPHLFDNSVLCSKLQFIEIVVES